MLTKKNIILTVAALTVSLIVGLSSFSLPVDWEIIKEKLPWWQKSKLEKMIAVGELKAVSCSTYQAWESKLQQEGYQIKTGEIKIPNWKITSLPTNLSQIESLSKKKRIFLSIILVGAYHANCQLLRDKVKLKQIDKKYHNSGQLNKEEKDWLADKIYKYRVQGKNQQEKIKKLKRKIDIVPLSLIMAQAACESGWGVSRFAQQANNIFGEWTFSNQAEGIVPKERPAGADYKIEKFSTIQEAINSYLLNLNSHPAYKKFRTLRWECRQQGEQITSLKLLSGLTNYSEEGKEYLNKVRAIIEDNNLVTYDQLLYISKER